MVTVVVTRAWADSVVWAVPLWAAKGLRAMELGVTTPSWGTMELKPGELREPSVPSRACSDCTSNMGSDPVHQWQSVWHGLLLGHPAGRSEI